MIALLLAAALLNPPVEDRIHYIVILDDPPGQIDSLGIQIVFKGEEDGESFLRLPIGFAGETELWKAVHDLSASGAELHETDQPFFYRLTYEPESLVSINYEIKQDWEGVPSAAEQGPYRAVIQPDYVHAYGTTIFSLLYEDMHTRMDRPTFVTMVNGPGTSLISDAISAETTSEVRDSIIVGGDFSVHQERIAHDNTLSIAWREGLIEDMDAFASELMDMMQIHSEFWQDSPGDYFVSILPLESVPGSYSYGGTNLGNAFAFAASAGAPEIKIARTLRHEHLHTWIAGAFESPNASPSEISEHWFSEGFTDFYTWRLGARSDDVDIHSVTDRLNEILLFYASLPTINRPQSSIANQERWSDPDIDELLYRRGFILALALDHAIREHTSDAMNLDSVMVASIHQNDTDLSAGLYILDQIKVRTGYDPAPLVNQILESGERVELEASVLMACGSFQTVQSPVFERGYDRDATQANEGVITGVIENSTAYQAGLRNGMRLLDRTKGEAGHAQKPFGLLVETQDGDELEIEWLPAGETSMTHQALVLDPDIDEAACLAQISGQSLN